MKFCGNCGNSVPDDARACPYCGSMLEGGPAPAPAKGGVGGFIQSHKKLLIAACAGIVGVLAVILILSAIFGGSYKTPIKNYYDRQNSLGDYDLEDRLVNGMDGFAKGELKDIYKILSGSKYFKDAKKSIEEDAKDSADYYKDEYGKDWEFTYEIDKDDVEEWDEDDCDDAKDSIKQIGKNLVEKGKEILKMDNDDLKDLADEMGLKKDELKEYAEALKELGTKLKEADVKKGCNVEVTYSITGKDDSLEDEDDEFECLKLDGKWTSSSNIMSTLSLLSRLEDALHE